eukprot:9503881-Pyramimonas_sp.AAC.2
MMRSITSSLFPAWTSPQLLRRGLRWLGIVTMLRCSRICSELSAADAVSSATWSRNLTLRSRWRRATSCSAGSARPRRPTPLPPGATDCESRASPDVQAPPVRSGTEWAAAAPAGRRCPASTSRDTLSSRRSLA